MIVRPEDLPNLQTVEEIFIELEDTKRYSISYKPILNNFKESNEYNLGFKLINFCEVDSDSIRPYAICDFDSAAPSTIKIKENKYKLHRYVMRIDIDVKPDAKVHPITIDNELNEIVERLKTYLGNDFIKFNRSGINRHYIGIILNEVVKL